VDYCNNIGNRLRREHGFEKPHNIRFWQIGNETSYAKWGYDLETAARRTVAFAKEMRKADADIEIIGWGDSGWAPRMIDVAGEHLQYVAFHHMFDPGRGKKGSPLRGIEYRKDPERTWAWLMDGYKEHKAKIEKIRADTKGYDIPLAMTECHYALRGRNRCEVLSTWAAGVSYARLLNVNERNGDVLKIATAADFCGTRWQVNAIMIPVPRGRAFMMPVAMVMSLYRKHTGEKAIDVTSVPDGLDVTASRTGDRVFLHVANTNRTRSVSARLGVDGMVVNSGRVFEIAIEPEYEVFEYRPEVTAPKEKVLAKNGEWTFPAASVSAVELDVGV
jgi:alpha-L-arabinofuranosidase